MLFSSTCCPTADHAGSHSDILHLQLSENVSLTLCFADVYYSTITSITTSMSWLCESRGLSLYIQFDRFQCLHRKHYSPLTLHHSGSQPLTKVGRLVIKTD